MSEHTIPELSAAQRKALRAEAHHLKPVVMVGEAGLTPPVLAETDRALATHGLIKLRVLGDDREARMRMLGEICAELGCAPVQAIGKLLVLWRPIPTPEPTHDGPHVPKKRAAVGAGVAPRKPAAKTAAGTGGRSARPATGPARATGAKPAGRAGGAGRSAGGRAEDGRAPSGRASAPGASGSGRTSARPGGSGTGRASAGSGASGRSAPLAPRRIAGSGPASGAARRRAEDTGRPTLHKARPAKSGASGRGSRAGSAAPKPRGAATGRGKKR